MFDLLPQDLDISFHSEPVVFTIKWQISYSNENSNQDIFLYLQENGPYLFHYLPRVFSAHQFRFVSLDS